MLKKEVLVSIVMPAYNCEMYIAESIKSILTQTYRNWELLVLDDCSNDNTLQIIQELSQQDSRIKVLSNSKNMGVSATRNKGIGVASGEWIAFLDSDDIWRQDKLEKQIELSNRQSANFIFTGSSYINSDGKAYKGVFEVPDKITYKKLRVHNVISCSSVLIKKKYFESVQMENDDIHEDYAVWLKILKSGVTAYGINEPLLIYRISKNSKSGNKFKTIKMTYGVFRFIGLNPIMSLYFTSRHLIASLWKYKKIYKE